MKLRIVLRCLVLGVIASAPPSASADWLSPLTDKHLASVLQNLQELVPANTGPGPYQIRIFEAPNFLGECGGSVSSCPDVDLYIVVSDDGLGNPATLYKLPLAKGWIFKGWLNGTKASGKNELEGFKIETSVPEANIDADELKAWNLIVYELWVSPTEAELSVASH